MSEETTPAEEPVAEKPTPPVTSAWSDVLEQLDALGDAIGRWTTAAVNDPDNRERAQELKEHVERMARKAGDAIDGASESAGKSDVGQAFKDAAGKTGEAFKIAGTRFTEEVAPKMASAFRGAADKLHQAAERMEYTEASEGANVSENEKPKEAE